MGVLHGIALVDVGVEMYTLGGLRLAEGGCVICGLTHSRVFWS